MKKQRSLGEDIGMGKAQNAEKVPLGLDIEKISRKVRAEIDFPETERKKNIMKKGIRWSASFAASFIIVCVLIVNIFPAAAEALSSVPLIGDIVRVVTLGRYEYNENGYEAEIVTPKIEGLLDKDLENRLNEEFKENADALIMAYEEDVRALKEAFGDETVHASINSDYVIKTNDENILALDVYIYTSAGSSSTKHVYYNIDKKENRLLSLKDLFSEDADYVTPISEYIIGQIEYENEYNNGLYWEKDDEFALGFDKIKEDQSFYINDKGTLVICFDKYEIAAGAQGCPEFEIPREVVEDILK